MKRRVALTGIVVTLVCLTLGLWAYGFVRPSRQRFPRFVSFLTGLDSSSFVLVTLDPANFGAPNRKTMLRWPILGEVAITRKEGDQLISAMSISVAKERTDYPGCFEPRHALKVRSRFGWADVVICFECGQMITEYGVGRLSLARDHMVLSRDQRAAFNRMAAAYRVPVAPPEIGDRSRG